METKKNILGLTILWLAASSHAAWAGWSSGGGELIKDANNPWFLANTRTVHYCVEIDETYFGLSRQRVETIAREAIGYWKEDFKRYSDEVGSIDDLGIATQTFELGPCGPRTDLTLKFGKLNPDEEAYLGDPRKYVAITVRTEYDEVSLRGRGFIYVSPQSGPLRMDGENLEESPWSRIRGDLLRHVLIHEFGHVFGIPHAGSDFEVMSAKYPEKMIQKGVADWVEDLFPLPLPFLNPRIEDGYCLEDKDGLEPWVRGFFNVPKGWQCVGFRLTKSGLRVLGSKRYGSKGKLLGTIKFNSIDSMERKPMIEVYLTERQRVFEEEREHGISVIIGPSPRESTRSGTYVSRGKMRRRPVLIRTAPGRITVGGLYGGKIIPDITDTSASLSPMSGSGRSPRRFSK